MALDYGSKTVGIALSDPFHLIASPLLTVTRERENKLRSTLRTITECVQQNDVELVVVGDPVNMDGTIGERAQKSREFAELLRFRLHCEELEVPVVLHDERLTTVEADAILTEALVPREDRKQVIDKIAAALILEDYLKQKGKDHNG